MVIVMESKRWEGSLMPPFGKFNEKDCDCQRIRQGSHGCTDAVFVTANATMRQCLDIS